MLFEERIGSDWKFFQLKRLDKSMKVKDFLKSMIEQDRHCHTKKMMKNNRRIKRESTERLFRFF